LRKIFRFFFYWRPKNKVGDVNGDTSSTFFDTDLPNLSPPLSLALKVVVVAKSTGPDIPLRIRSTVRFDCNGPSISVRYNREGLCSKATIWCQILFVITVNSL